MSGWTTTHVDEIDTLSMGDPAIPQWKPLRHALGIGAFGTNIWQAAVPGEKVVERHDELVDAGVCDAGGGCAGHEELYVVLSGAADFTVDGHTFPVRAGSLVFLSDPRLVREAVATEAGTTVLAVGGPPGEAFSPSEWETRWLQRASPTAS